LIVWKGEQPSAMYTGTTRKVTIDHTPPIRLATPTVAEMAAKPEIEGRFWSAIWRL
jgi:hypothetical protein